MNIKIYGYFYTRSAGNIKNAKIKIKKKFFLTIFSINSSQIWKNRDIFTIMHQNTYVRLHSNLWLKKIFWEKFVCKDNKQKKW